MKEPKDMGDIADGVGRLLRKLGMGEIRHLLELQEGWDDIAGRPWAGAARPIGIRRGELVVEASDPGMVSMLRYASAGLVEAVSERLGEGVVTSVKVVPPPPGGPR